MISTREIAKTISTGVHLLQEESLAMVLHHQNIKGVMLSTRAKAITINIDPGAHLSNKSMAVALYSPNVKWRSKGMSSRMAVINPGAHILLKESLALLLVCGQNLQ